MYMKDRMMNRKIYCTVLAVVSVNSIASVQAESVSLEATMNFESRYVFRGVQYSESSFQPGIELAYGSFYAGTWMNLPVGDYDQSARMAYDEIDIYAGYGFEVNDSIYLDAGINYYTYPDSADGFFDTYDRDEETGSNTFEAYAGISAALPMDPSLYIYYDFNYETVAVQADASYSYPLGEKTSVDLSGSVGYLSVPGEDADSYTYGNLALDLSVYLSENGSVSGGIRYGGSGLEGGGIVDDYALEEYKSTAFWFGIGYSTGF